MNYLKYDLNQIGPDSTVEVELSAQANVRLMDAANFSRFHRGLRHQMYGGLAKRSPVRILIPYFAHWYAVIDLGGYGGQVRASVRVIS